MAKLVAGPRVYICDRCVALASRLMTEESGRGLAPAPERASPIRTFIRALRRLGRAGSRGTPMETRALAAEVV